MPTDAEDRDPDWRKLLARLGFVCGVAALLAVLLGAINGESFNPRVLLMVIVVQPLNAAALGLLGWRLSVLSRGSVPVWSGVKATALAGSLLYVIPSRLSEFVKPVYLSAHCGIGLLQGVALVAVERLLDALVVTAILLAALTQLSTQASPHTLYVWIGMSIFGMAACALLIRYPTLFNCMIAWLPGHRLRSAAERLLTEIRLTIAPHILAAAALISVVIWLVSFGMVYLLLLGASVPLNMAAVAWVFLAGALGLTIGIAPGGLGTFETAIVVALKYHNVGTAEAINLALLIRLANLGIVPLIAIWAIAADKTGLAELVCAARSLRKRRAGP